MFYPSFYPSLVYGEGNWGSCWFRGLVTSMSSGMFKQFVSPTFKMAFSRLSNRDQKMVSIIDGPIQWKMFLLSIL